MTLNRDNVKCFFDIKIDDQDIGRIVFKLFYDVCPKTCENFRQLCTGEAGFGLKTKIPLHFKGTIFHRVVKSFIIQGGDIESGDGRGGDSIYGGCFEDENFTLIHDEPYLLSMANKGPNTNKSQFFITTNEAPHLDGKHVVFGRVISGLDTILQVERQQVDSKSRPLKRISIVDCGELKVEEAQRSNLLSGFVSSTEKHVSKSTTLSHRPSKRFKERSERSKDSRSSSSSSSSPSQSSSSSNTDSSSSSLSSSKHKRFKKRRVSASSTSSSRSSVSTKRNRIRTNRRLEDNKRREAVELLPNKAIKVQKTSSKQHQLVTPNIEQEREKITSSEDESAPNPNYKCTVKRKEIPQDPAYRFLLREPHLKSSHFSATNTSDVVIDVNAVDLSKFVDIEDDANQDKNDQLADNDAQTGHDSTEKTKGLKSQVKSGETVTISKSGRIMKGRGKFKFRSPTPDRQSINTKLRKDNLFERPYNDEHRTRKRYDDYGYSRRALRSRSRSPHTFKKAKTFLER